MTAAARRYENARAIGEALGEVLRAEYGADHYRLARDMGAKPDTAAAWLEIGRAHAPQAHNLHWMVQAIPAVRRWWDETTSAPRPANTDR